METANEHTHIHIFSSRRRPAPKSRCARSLSLALFLPRSCQESCHFSPSACLSFSFHHHKLTRVMYASKTFIFSSFPFWFRKFLLQTIFFTFFLSPGQVSNFTGFPREKVNLLAVPRPSGKFDFLSKGREKGEKEKFFSSRKDKRTHARTHGQQVPSASRDRFATDPSRRSRNPKLHGPLDRNSLYRDDPPSQKPYFSSSSEKKWSGRDSAIRARNEPRVFSRAE